VSVAVKQPMIPCPAGCGGEMPSARLKLGYESCGPCNTLMILDRKARIAAVETAPAPSNNFGKGSWT
jgi:hypothetical protein